MLMTLMTDAASGLTRLLAAVGGGDAAAVNQLTPAVYEELRRFAKRHMAGRRNSPCQPNRRGRGGIGMVSCVWCPRIPQNLLATDRGESRHWYRQRMNP